MDVPEDLPSVKELWLFIALALKFQVQVSVTNYNPCDRLCRMILKARNIENSTLISQDQSTYFE